MNEFPEGKFLATVKIGQKGQIVIPKEVRDMFGLQADDTLLLMADKSQGIGLQPFSYAENFFHAFKNLNGTMPKESDEK